MAGGVRLLGTGRLADEIAAQLSAGGLVVVAGDVKLARALAERDLEVAVSSTDRFGKDDLRVVAIDELDAGAASGAVIAGVAQLDDGVERVRALARAVSPGGRVVLLDRGSRTRASRCALLGGLSRLRQAVVSRTVVTSGVV